MADESAFRSKLDSFLETLGEQPWFIEAKGKWEELDPQSKTNLKLGILGGSVLLYLIFILAGLWNVHSYKREIAEKRNLLNSVQAASEEMRRLRDVVPQAAGESVGGPWVSYFEQIATTQGIDKANLQFSSEKAGANYELAKEALFDIVIKHVNIRQMTQFAATLETGSRPVKIRNLSVETKADAPGYLDVTLSVSGFNKVKNDF